MSDWVTAADLAASCGVCERDIAEAAGLVGVADSRVHARWEGGRLSLSKPAANMVRVEIRARLREAGNAPGRGMVDAGEETTP